MEPQLSEKHKKLVETALPYITPDDLQRLLARHRKTAFIWCTCEVLKVRPDLTHDEAWDVLQTCSKDHDPEHGMGHLVIEFVAENLYPESVQPTINEGE